MTSPQTYSYDPNGNRNSTGYVTGPNNELLSDGTYNYTTSVRVNWRAWIFSVLPCSFPPEERRG
jgi:hypothetical protein